MTKYKQLGQEQRYAIGQLFKAGKTQTEIAALVGCHKSTISRELKRNTPQRGRGAKVYDPVSAQAKTDKRHREKPKHQRFTESMRRQIVRWLTVEKLSPELISAKGRAKNPEFVSHEAIYQWIWACKFSHRQADRPYHNLYSELKHGRRRRKRGRYRDNRGCIPNRISIEKRPAIVQKRTRLGDIETDLMLGRNHQAGLIVMVDRTSLKTVLVKITNKVSRVIAGKMITKMKPFRQWLKTFTFDNDQAFSKHETVNRILRTKSFFTHPYTSQEKGTVENRIGVLRRFFPKRIDFTQVSAKRVRQVEQIINERPIRKFGYRTANEVFEKKLSRIKRLRRR